MDPPWCLSVTHRLWHRHHHLAPRVAFNDFPVKDVSVMFAFVIPVVVLATADDYSAVVLNFYLDKNVNVM